MGIFDIVPSRQRRANLPMATDPDRDPIHALQVDLDRAFGSFWNLMPFPSSNALLRELSGVDDHAFKVDMRENDNEVKIVAELPGFAGDDVDVAVEAGSISIRAERQEERQERGSTAVMLERSVGILERTIPLPAGSLPDEATAQFKNGILTIVVPKAVASKPRQGKIKVQTS